MQPQAVTNPLSARRSSQRRGRPGSYEALAERITERFPDLPRQLQRIARFALDAREAILKQAVAENARAVELANVRYRVGSGDLRGVLQQSLALYATQVSLIRVRSERLVQRVNLYLALGGSFDEIYGWSGGMR